MDGQFGMNEKRRQIIVWAVVLAVAAFGVVLIVFGTAGDSSSVSSEPVSIIKANMTLAEKRAQMLERVREADTKPLTESEKAEIFQAIGGTRALEYAFTREEQQEIVKAMNGR